MPAAAPPSAWAPTRWPRARWILLTRSRFRGVVLLGVLPGTRTRHFRAGTERGRDRARWTGPATSGTAPALCRPPPRGDLLRQRDGVNVGKRPRAGGSMATAVRHYAGYRPRPFTPDERKDVTLLFGGLTWKHERLMQGALENVGYRHRRSPNIARDRPGRGQGTHRYRCLLPTDLYDRQPGPLPAGSTANRGCGCRRQEIRFPDGRRVRPVPLRPVPRVLHDGPRRPGASRLPSVPPRPDAAGPGLEPRAGGLEINLLLLPRHRLGDPLGDLLTDLEYRDAPGRGVPARPTACSKESVDSCTASSATGPDTRGKLGTSLAPADPPTSRRRSARFREVGRHRGRPPASQGPDEDHRASSGRRPTRARATTTSSAGWRARAPR